MAWSCSCEIISYQSINWLSVGAYLSVAKSKANSALSGVSSAYTSSFRRHREERQSEKMLKYACMRLQCVVPWEAQRNDTPYYKDVFHYRVVDDETLTNLRMQWNIWIFMRFAQCDPWPPSFPQRRFRMFHSLRKKVIFYPQPAVRRPAVTRIYGVGY